MILWSGFGVVLVHLIRSVFTTYCNPYYNGAGNSDFLLLVRGLNRPQWGKAEVDSANKNVNILLCYSPFNLSVSSLSGSKWTKVHPKLDYGWAYLHHTYSFLETEPIQNKYWAKKWDVKFK